MKLTQKNKLCLSPFPCFKYPHQYNLYVLFNVCGLASKLKYNIIQEYIEKFDIICLTETKCLLVDEHDIKEYKCFSMSPKIKKNKYGGIHGICILVKAHLAINCHIIDTLSSESILWPHVKIRI